MNLRYTKVLLLIVIIILLYKTFNYLRLNDEINIEEDINIDPLPVAVYYEALCPDSRFFVSYQLLPAFKEFQNYIKLDLVPYGKAQTIETDNKIEFHCQHDAVECFANKIHACVIELVEDPTVQLEYIACMIKDNAIPEEAGERCAQDFSIKYEPISDCANGVRGSELLKKHGERTNSLNPSVTFIPTIELKNSQSLVPQTQILKDFNKALCIALKKKPSKCTLVK